MDATFREAREGGAWEEHKQRNGDPGGGQNYRDPEGGRCYRDHGEYKDLRGGHKELFIKYDTNFWGDLDFLSK